MPKFKYLIVRYAEAVCMAKDAEETVLSFETTK